MIRTLAEYLKTYTTMIESQIYSVFFFESLELLFFLYFLRRHLGGQRMVQFNMEVASNQTVPFWRTSTKNYSEWLNETENESLSITSHPYHMMLNHVWTTAFSIMVIIGMFGNGSVLWIILGELRFFNKLSKY